MLARAAADAHGNRSCWDLVLSGRSLQLVLRGRGPRIGATIQLSINVWINGAAGLRTTYSLHQSKYFLRMAEGCEAKAASQLLWSHKGREE
jgi:hypothetical protein